MRSVSSDGNQPGARAFTRTPRSAQLAASIRVIASDAALLTW
jgi:hypothetical protein